MWHTTCAMTRHETPTSGSVPVHTLIPPRGRVSNELRFGHVGRSRRPVTQAGQPPRLLHLPLGGECPAHVVTIAAVTTTTTQIQEITMSAARTCIDKMMDLKRMFTGKRRADRQPVPVARRSGRSPRHLSTSHPYDRYQMDADRYHVTNR